MMLYYAKNRLCKEAKPDLKPEAKAKPLEAVGTTKAGELEPVEVVVRGLTWGVMKDPRGRRTGVWVGNRDGMGVMTSSSSSLTSYSSSELLPLSSGTDPA